MNREIFFSSRYTSEPVGSASPKFSTLATLDNIRGFVAKENLMFSLLCPAQGFPVPNFRLEFFFLSFSFSLFLEPVGTKAPTFSVASKSFSFVQNLGTNFSLLCQAQGFPVPSFRWVFWFRFAVASCRLSQPEMVSNGRSNVQSVVASGKKIFFFFILIRIDLKPYLIHSGFQTWLVLLLLLSLLSFFLWFDLNV